MTVTVAPRFKQSTRWTAKAIKISDAKKTGNALLKNALAQSFFCHEILRCLQIARKCFEMRI